MVMSTDITAECSYEISSISSIQKGYELRFLGNNIVGTDFPSHKLIGGSHRNASMLHLPSVCCNCCKRRPNNSG